MPIVSALVGNKNNWPRNLAELINNQSAGLLAGIRDNNDNITPAIGKNDVFALSDSAIVRVETSFEIDVDNNGLEIPQVTVVLDESQLTSDESLSVGFSVETNQTLNVSTQLFFEGVSVGITETEVTGLQNLMIELAATGNYSLVVVALRSSDKQSIQSTSSLEIIEQVELNSNYKYAYPQHIGSYIEGDRVLGLDGNIYQCMVVGWCNNRSATYYSPGIGLAWKQVASTPAAGNANADFIYLVGLGQYSEGTVVTGSDNRLYRCKVAGWCNNTSALHYAPDSGIAWDSAWELLSN